MMGLKCSQAHPEHLDFIVANPGQTMSHAPSTTVLQYEPNKLFPFLSM